MSKKTSLLSGSVMTDPFVTLWTVAFQIPLFLGFPRLEYWGGLPFPPPGYFPDPGIKFMSLAWASVLFTTEPLGKLPGSYSNPQYGSDSFWAGQGRCLRRDEVGGESYKTTNWPKVSEEWYSMLSTCRKEGLDLSERCHI